MIPANFEKTNIINWLTDAFLLLVGFLYILLISDADTGFITGSFDLIIVFLFIIFNTFRNGFSAIYILILLISFDIHSYGASQLGNFALFYQISWLVNAFLLIFQPGLTEASVIYHLGLGFETSMMRNTGLGMQMSYYCSNQVILLLAVVVKRLELPFKRFSLDIRHLIAFFVGLTLLNHHSIVINPGYTSQYLMLFFSLILFWATSPRENKNAYIVALMAGGFIVVINSYLNSFLVAESLAEFFSRRASVSGIHANRLAAWILSMLWFLLFLQKDRVIKKKVSVVIFIILSLLLILTGARLVLMIALISFVFYFLIEKGYRLSLKSLTILLIVSGLFALRISQQISLNELVQNERFSIWYSAWQNFLQEPFTGHGIMSFPLLPQFVYDDNRYWILDWNYPHSHQLILEILLWGGVVLFSGFLLVTAISFYRNKSRLYRFALISLLLTGVADFAWNTPSMTTLASFLLFFPLAIKAKTIRIKAPFKLVAVLLLGVSIYGAVNLRHSIFLFESASKKYQNGKRGWRKMSEKAAAHIGSEPYAAIHNIVRKLAADHSLKKLATKSKRLTQKFSQYFASHFLFGRIMELEGKSKEAFKAYKKSLKLEPLDLSGIRTARLIVAGLKANKKINMEQKLVECMIRDDWGVYICINHPLFGNLLKEKTKNIINDFVKNRGKPTIERLLLALNLAKTGLLEDYKVLEKIDIDSFPEWLKDKRDALLLLMKNNDKAVREDKLKKILLTNPGPQVCKSIMKLALKNKIPELALKAYKMHRDGFKYRNKNHEDLEAQFLAAKAFILSKNYKKALFEINRIRAYAPGSPFVMALKAETLFDLRNYKQALESFKFARKLIINSRALPFAIEEPDEKSWAEGTHLTKLIEKTARFKDPEALSYCKKKWFKLKKELFIKEKLIKSFLKNKKN